MKNKNKAVWGARFNNQTSKIFENAAMNGRNIKYAFSVNALSRVLDHIFLANKASSGIYY